MSVNNCCACLWFAFAIPFRGSLPLSLTNQCSCVIPSQENTTLHCTALFCTAVSRELHAQPKNSRRIHCTHHHVQSMTCRLNRKEALQYKWYVLCTYMQVTVQRFQDCLLRLIAFMYTANIDKINNKSVPYVFRVRKNIELH